MNQIELIAQKRAFPSRGRARIHGEDLSKLEAEEGAAIEVSILDMDKWVTVTAFVDALVDKGSIRLSEEDLKAIGADAGGKLRVRKKAPMTEQIKTTVKGAATSVSSGLGKAGESIKGTTPESISTGAKEAAAGVGTSLGKAGESISTAFSQAVEAAIKKLKPADAVILDKALKANEGEVRAVVVPAGITARPMKTITTPKGVVIAAVQRGDSIQTTDSSFILLSGDTVYLVGKSNLLDEATKVIGG